ncbi:LOW QUALITY PROTEIN: duodenase-1-like [Natator depressus]|uniref:LOW QUALITY PROTEIN: duodenase-1-like n=1 Tax=Natator depressus TaxID=27790 RepID=UPI003EBED900
MQLQILLLLPMTFFLSPGAHTGEIIGGRKAKPHSRPYMAYLERKTCTGEEMCGGFLVREDFVLTAAHCGDGDITVLLGAHNVLRKEKTQQRVSVRQKIPHPRYNKMSIENDLMLLQVPPPTAPSIHPAWLPPRQCADPSALPLLQLAEPAELDDAVYTIPLPQAGHTVDPGSVCSVAGWGKTNRDAKLTTNILQEVELEVMSNETCQEDRQLRRYYKPSKMMCVGNPDENKATFSGDSGGPLVCDGTAQGIVSFGKNDGSPPRVFTRVSAYVPWIKKTMRGLSSPGSHPEIPASLH